MRVDFNKIVYGLITLTLISFTSNGQTSNTWLTKNSSSAVARVDAIAFSIGGKGYIGNSDFWEYDPLTDVWFQKANTGGVTRLGAIGFSIGNKGYFGTGTTSTTTYLNDFWEYDPLTNIWTQKANVGGLGRADAIGFCISNKGYVGLGTNFPSAATDFWEYDPVTDNWTQKANYPPGSRSQAVSFAIGNIGYVGTGMGNNYPSSIYAYDPLTNVWTLKNYFPDLTRYRAVGFSIGNLGYIGTGSSSTMPTGPFQRDFWEYNPMSNIWTKRANLPGLERAGAFGFVIGSTGYIGGGISSSGNTYNDFYAYTPCLVDVSVIKNGNIISANQSGATYQWVSNCASGNTVSISGATSQSYTTTVDGSYAVNITYGGCVSTSSCITISSVGIAELDPYSKQPLNIFPNPNNGTVTLKSTTECSYQVINNLGQPIKSFQLNSNNNFTTIIEDLPIGIYNLIGKQNNQTITQKIIVIK